MNIAEAILSKGADSATAVLHRGEATTYQELREKTVRIAIGLLDRGHVKGDRVGILSENSPFFATAYLGIIRAGLTAVPFQTEVTAGTFAEIVSGTGIREVFVSNRFRKRVQPWAEELGVSQPTLFRWKRQAR